MNKLKKNLSVWPLLVTLALVLAACGGGAPAANPTTAAGTTAGGAAATTAAVAATTAAATTQPAADTEPVPIHIFNRLNPEVMLDDNPILKELENRMNVVIEYEAPPINNYLDKLQITMASGELPDIMYNWGGADVNYEQWVKSGLLAELDDKLPDYENLQANISRDMFEAMRSATSGKIHCVPKTNMINYWGFSINKQWMETLNLSTPTTLDEFTEVFRAMSLNDPDGDGKQNTFGLSSTENTSRVNIAPIAAAFGVRGAIKDYDGEYKLLEKMSGYIPYVTYLRELYAEKLFDTEFFTNKVYVDSEKRRAGTVGMTVSHQGGLLGELKNVENALEKFDYIAGPVDTTGKQIAYEGLPIWGGFMLSADSENIDKCLELIDYGNGQEGFVLMAIGIEGVHYNSYDFESRMVDRTPEQAGEFATWASTYLQFAFAMDGMPCIIENGDTKELVDAFHATFDPIREKTELIMTPSVSAPKTKTWAADNPDMAKKFQETEIQYIVGEITLEDFQTFLNDEYFPAHAEDEAEYIQWLKDYENRQ